MSSRQIELTAVNETAASCKQRHNAKHLNSSSCAVRFGLDHDLNMRFTLADGAARLR